MWKELTFNNLKNARANRKKFRKIFGYTPQIFRIKNPRTGKTKYVIVKPKGLKKIK